MSTRIDVAAPREHAFRVFTEGIATWWDEDKHILQAPLADMVFEPYVGGGIVDRGTDGSECRWARVLAYEPPDRVCFSWDISLSWQIETDPARTSEVEITFTELDPARTRVELVHRHLDRHGEGWEGMRNAVSSGWSLEGFAKTAEQPFSGVALGRSLPVVSDATMQERLAGTRDYTAVVLAATESFARPAHDALVWEHGRRNMALVEAGLLTVVLPVTDGSGVAGYGVFTTDVEQTRRILDDDPGVRAGIFRYEVHPVRGFPGAALP
ncbi:SRPBCC family protein [Actinomycetospora chiangmaiensis]|uniref:SRPBCC family protein n=1 Tax=Actinomycetospora chiangmaiensis TaxID=402650 RepID=UPI001B7F812D|nr:SRPBCC family protein [Actinomycetospora chiangmaiensis]